MVPLAAAGLLVLAFALAGRRRLARLLIPLGIVVLAISLIVDAPKGLDEGQAALAYQGAKACLLERLLAADRDRGRVGGLRFPAAPLSRPRARPRDRSADAAAPAAARGA